PTPADLTLTALSSSQVSVTVTSPPNATTGYTQCQIQRSADSINWVTIKGSSNVYTVTDTGLIGGRTYFYRVVYLNGDARFWTPWSPPKSITPPLSTPGATDLFNGTAMSSTSILW